MKANIVISCFVTRASSRNWKGEVAILGTTNIKFYALQKPQKTWDMFKTQSQTIQSCRERECLFLGVKAPLGLAHVTFAVTGVTKNVSKK